MNTYRVVIHYEGAWVEDVDAVNEDEAKEIAMDRICDVTPEELISNMADWSVCDCWKVNGHAD